MSDMQFDVRRAVTGDEPGLRELRLQALTDSPGAFSSTYERELARTTEDWRRWLASGATFILEAGGAPCGTLATPGNDSTLAAAGAPSPGRFRLESVDIVRGVIMIFMALDHTRDFFGITGFSPTDPAQTTI